MALSREMRELANKWDRGQSWPRRLDWLEIRGIRGWNSQRINFAFPFVAVVGENGAGKSTILQAAASVYRFNNSYYASDFFPDTPWETVRNASIKYSVREGDLTTESSVRKPSVRWRGNPERRERTVKYVDLRRTLPISAQVGYSRIAKPGYREADRRPFDDPTLARFSQIIGRQYAGAGHSLSNADNTRWVPIAQVAGAQYSGFHQGAGEFSLSELLKLDPPRYSLLLIDEVETSLHPRAQRRLVRDLAELCRVSELQVIVTTHSPYILDELPTAARIYVMNSADGKELITGVSPQFAMTQMDDEPYPEVDVYVEDDIAGIFLEEILAVARRPLLRRCAIIPFGAASVGLSLGIMAAQDRFPRPTVVLLDADQEPADGCSLLPGNDAPERVVFTELQEIAWRGVSDRIGRGPAETADALGAAMAIADHHEWIRNAADRLVMGGNTLWRALCGVAAAARLDRAVLTGLADEIEDTLPR